MINYHIEFIIIKVYEMSINIEDMEQLKLFLSFTKEHCLNMNSIEEVELAWNNFIKSIKTAVSNITA